MLGAQGAPKRASFPTTRTLNARSLTQATKLLNVSSDDRIEPKGMTWVTLGDRLERDCLSGTDGITEVIAKLRASNSDFRKQFFIFYMTLTAVVKDQDREWFVNKFGGLPSVLPFSGEPLSDRGYFPLKYNWPWEYEPRSKFNFRASFYQVGRAARVDSFWQQAKADNIYPRLR